MCSHFVCMRARVGVYGCAHAYGRERVCMCMCVYLLFRVKIFYFFLCFLICSRYRYTAYRQLTRFVWGYLGKEIRVILPACAVTEIRKNFPSADGSYTGYLEAD